MPSGRYNILSMADFPIKQPEGPNMMNMLAMMEMARGMGRERETDTIMEEYVSAPPGKAKEDAFKKLIVKDPKRATAIRLSNIQHDEFMRKNDEALKKNAASYFSQIDYKNPDKGRAYLLNTLPGVIQQFEQLPDSNRFIVTLKSLQEGLKGDNWKDYLETTKAYRRYLEEYKPKTKEEAVELETEKAKGVEEAKLPGKIKVEEIKSAREAKKLEAKAQEDAAKAEKKAERDFTADAKSMFDDISHLYANNGFANIDPKYQKTVTEAAATAEKYLKSGMDYNLAIQRGLVDTKNQQIIKGFETGDFGLLPEAAKYKKAMAIGAEVEVLKGYANKGDDIDVVIDTVLKRGTVK